MEYFIQFITSCERNKFIFQWNDKTNCIIVIRLEVLNKIPVNISVIGNYLVIYFDTGIEISMRLHTASSKITKTLSLKYDTKFNNILGLFTNFTI